MGAVGIVGLGLIGGSIARRALELGLDVAGADPDVAVERAPARGGVRIVGRPADLDGDSPIVLATPTPATEHLLRSGALPSGLGLVIDTASTKATVASLAQFGSHGLASRFVGGHPMAGKADGGFEHSEAALLVWATWALTPGRLTQSGRVTEAIGLIDSLFDSPSLVISPAAHDAMVARTSHLPHVLGQAIIHSVGQDTPLAAALAAGSFEGATRVVRGSSTFPAELVWANRGQVAELLTSVVDDLAAIRDALLVEGRDGVSAWFAQSDLDVDRTETVTIPAPRSARELAELVGFGEAGWLARPGPDGDLVLSR